jgi:hypothetical protein
VEFYGQHKNHDSSVMHLVFLPSEVSHVEIPNKVQNSVPVTAQKSF